MTYGLTSILPELGNLASASFIVFLRVGAMLAVLPAFGERAIPMRIRLVLAIAFTAIVAPAVTQDWDVKPLSGLSIGAYALTEAIVGLLLGLTLRLFILALQTAGSIAAQATSLSQIFGGTAAEPMPAIGHLLVVSGLALAVIFGLHVRIAEWMILSYEFFPVGQMPDPALVSSWGVARVAKAFSIGFMLAAPFLIASLIYNLTLGVINKAMPQLMVAFVGAPVITAGGLFLLFVSAPVLLDVWVTALNAFIANPYGGAG